MGLLERIQTNHKVIQTKTLKAKYGEYQFHFRDNGMLVVAKGDMFVGHVNNTSSAFQCVCIAENDDKTIYSEKDLK